MFDKMQIKFVRNQNGLWDIFVRGFNGVTKIILHDIKEEEARLNIEEHKKVNNDKYIEVVVEE